jgi:hypothetical protein
MLEAHAAVPSAEQEKPNMRTRRHRLGHVGFLALATFTLLLQISCSDGPTLKVADDHLIVPDTRIGPIKLGMSDQELFQVGVPSGTRPNAENIAYFFGDRTVFVDAQTRRVDRIYTWSKADRTSTGAGVGSSLQDLFRVFGPPTKTVVGNDVCGVPGRVERVYYQRGDMELGFSRRGASCADAPTNQVQAVGIKTPGVGFF